MRASATATANVLHVVWLSSGPNQPMPKAKPGMPPKISGLGEALKARDFGNDVREVELFFSFSRAHAVVMAPKSLGWRSNY